MGSVACCECAAGCTKMFNIMLAREFARRLNGQGIDCFACHPGELAFWPLSFPNLAPHRFCDCCRGG